ncbi:MAG TPA: RidA family protein [Frankiaceae bacterium]|nr:RidA family protein [Frankiaceae bacterium]
MVAAASESQHNAMARLADLGLRLPPVAAPVAAYVPAVRSGDLVFTSGQLPFVDGVLPATGLVSADGADGTVSAERASELAARCALNALAAVHALVGLPAGLRVVKVTGFVASAPGFTGQPGVVDGASQLLGEMFGDHGRHARSAVGVAALPLGSPVEIELILQVPN